MVRVGAGKQGGMKRGQEETFQVMNTSSILTVIMI